jgi:hypothetical protein
VFNYKEKIFLITTETCQNAHFHIHFLSREQIGLSIYASRLIFILGYLVASLYNLIWDCVVDWGLLPDPDHFIRYVSGIT